LLQLIQAAQMFNDRDSYIWKNFPNNQGGSMENDAFALEKTERMVH